MSGIAYTPEEARKLEHYRTSVKIEYIRALCKMTGKSFIQNRTIKNWYLASIYNGEPNRNLINIDKEMEGR